MSKMVKYKLTEEKLVYEILDKVDQEMTEKIYNFFNVESVSPDDTRIFIGLSHDQLLKSLMKWLESKKSEAIYPITIHSWHEAGIDILMEFSHLKIGIQVHSYEDIKGEKESFGTKVTRQIGESLKYPLSGRIIVYCGDMTDPSQKDKVLRSIIEISKMKNISIRCVPPEKAAAIIKRNF